MGEICNVCRKKLTFLEVVSGDYALSVPDHETHMNEDLNDVSDPSDFKSEFLQSLDASLRCAICKDIIEAPVMAPCSHSFCSLVWTLYSMKTASD